MRRTVSIRRRGYTLIELLVVISIIALLAGMLVTAISKFRRMGPQVQTKAEIGELGLAVENFKSTYQVDYVPPALYLSSNYAPPFPAPANADEVNANRAVADSLAYLKKVWSKAAWTSPAPAGPLPANTMIPLDGNQVLVFLLGGIPPQDSRFPAPWSGQRLGFHNSATDPFNKVGVSGSTPFGTPPSAMVKGPFFDFKSERIDANAHYLDPYGWPYYYFSSKIGNDYDYFGIYKPLLNSANDPYGYNNAGGYGGIAAQSVPAMNPFRGLDNKYLNPNSFQIISAGHDKLPGAGSPFDPNVNKYVPYDPGISNRLSPNGPASDYNPGGTGGDDISNFRRGMLGSD